MLLISNGPDNRQEWKCYREAELAEIQAVCPSLLSEYSEFICFRSYGHFHGRTMTCCAEGFKRLYEIIHVLYVLCGVCQSLTYLT